MKAKSNNNRGKVDISVSQNFITSKNTIYKLIKKQIYPKMILLLKLDRKRSYNRSFMWKKLLGYSYRTR